MLRADTSFTLVAKWGLGLAAVPVGTVLLVVLASGVLRRRVGGDAFIRQMRDVNHYRFALHRGRSPRLPRRHGVGLAFDDHRLVELLLFILYVVVVKELPQGC